MSFHDRCDTLRNSVFETNQHELTQHTLLIDASIDIQILRASQRDHQTIEQIQTIIKTQMSREQKQALAMILW
jgi:dephospho-CoA kinase